MCMDKYGLSEGAWTRAVARGDVAASKPRRYLPPVTDPMVCARCNKSKPLSEYGFKSERDNIRHRHCLECHRKYNTAHYASNKKYYIEKADRWNAANKFRQLEELFDYFQTHPCVDCGETNPIKLQFDHVRGVKCAEVSTLIHRGKSLISAMDEVAKCDIRCANCHAVKTAKESGWRWVVFLESKGISV